MPFTEEQIAQLAPDAASLSAGKMLANARHWPLLAVNARVLWGEVQGSGATPYRTQVDLLDTAFKCTCPSRKFPCKHALGLLLLHAQQATLFAENQTAPDWVLAWMDKRPTPAASNTLPVDTSRSEAQAELAQNKAKEKREADRYALVQNGVAELELLLRDLIRTGLLSIPDKGAAYFEKVAARMVDAKAPGLANLVRGFSEIPYAKQGDWHASALAQAAQAWLVLEGFRNLDNLPAPIREDIRTLIGWTQKKSELLENASLTVLDDWVVASVTTTEEADLTVQRTWLYGLETQKAALLLDFAHKTQAPPPQVLNPGSLVNAELVFFPSNLPCRALLKTQGAARSTWESVRWPTGYHNWGEAQVYYAQQLALFPWVDNVLISLGQLRPIVHPNGWFLRDRDDCMLEIHPSFEANRRWKLLALSGGHPLDLLLLYTNHQVLPLGIIERDHYIFL